MKAIVIVTCLFIVLSPLVPAAVAQTSVLKAISNGVEGDVQPGPCNADGFCLQFFEVVQTNAAVTLSFQFSTPDNQALSGLGVIPSSDLSVSPQEVVVSTDTSADATFTGFTNLICDFSGDCNPAPGGTITFTFTQISAVTTNSTSTSKTQTSTFTIIHTGTSLSHSAAVSGSFSLSGYSTSFPPGELFGSISKNNNVQIIITR